MRRFFLLAAALPIISASAQYNTRNEWYLGPTAGGTMSTVTLVPKLVDKLFLYGKTGGLIVRYISENHFGLQTELTYLQTGWLEDEQGLGEQYSYRRQLSFVDIPFLVHAYTGKGAFRTYINAGPRFCYLLSDQETILPTSTQLLQHGKAIESPLQYGILGGLGVECRIKRHVFGLEGRYTYFVSNLFSDNVEDDFDASNVQVITLNAYWLFRVH